MSGFLSHQYLCLCSVEVYRKYHSNPTHHFGGGIVVVSTDLGEIVLAENRQEYRYALKVYSSRTIEDAELTRLFPDVGETWGEVKSQRA